MEKIWNGAARFNTVDAHTLRPLLSRLAREGQSPDALFITCADSRVVPEVITGSSPGDLFVMRNIGNLVPRYDDRIGGDSETSVAAVLEFALDVLRIQSIIVCGHSDCGAMKAITQQKEMPDEPHLQHWLLHADESFRRLPEEKGLITDLPRHDQLAQSNVVQQLENLQTYPCVANALRAANVQISGWFFDISRAEVRVYDARKERFCRIEQMAYAAHFTRTGGLPPVSRRPLAEGRAQ